MRIFKPLIQNYLIILIAIVFVLTGCASTSVTSIPKKKIDYPLSALMVVCIQSKEKVGGFNEGNYNKYIKNSFCSVNNLKMREQLEESMKRYLCPKGDYPRIVTSYELFKPNEEYTYDEFMNEFNKTGCQGILLINTTDYWLTTDYVTSHYDQVSVTRTSNKPNSANFTYLYDLTQSQDYIWIGKFDVEGIYAGYETVNNHLARKIASKLRKEKYIVSNPL
jgi:hypothetical protein